MFGNQQGPRPSAPDTEAREWEAIDKAQRQNEMTREHVERSPVDRRGGQARAWFVGLRDALRLAGRSIQEALSRAFKF
jgi:hypothetical protein